MAKNEKGDALTTREVADRVGTEPRTLRRFLRANDRGVGAGSRYEFGPDDVADLKKRFTEWQKADDAKREAKDAPATPKAKVDPKPKPAPKPKVMKKPA